MAPTASKISASARAFTLIELLMVLSIIALLASLLLSGTAVVLDSARTGKCLNNQRQIALAMIAYAGNWDGRLPRSSSGYNWGGAGGVGPYSNWSMALFADGVLGSGDEGMFFCPGETISRWTQTNPTTPNIYNSRGVRSYSGNGMVDDPAVYPGATDLVMSGPDIGLRTSRPLGNLIHSVQAPVRCILTSECVNGGISNGSNLGANNDLTWATWRHRRNSASTFAFVDGHAKLVLGALRATPAQLALPKFTAVYLNDATNQNLIDPARY